MNYQSEQFNQVIRSSNHIISILQFFKSSLKYLPGNPHESLVGLDLVLVVAVEEGDDPPYRVVQPHEVRGGLARGYRTLKKGLAIKSSVLLYLLCEGSKNTLRKARRQYLQVITYTYSMAFDTSDISSSVSNVIFRSYVCAGSAILDERNIPTPCNICTGLDYKAPS